MIIDGKAIAQSIAEEIRIAAAAHAEQLRLVIIYVGEDSVIDSFVRIKERFGAKVGIDVVTKRYPKTTTTEEILDEIDLASRAQAASGQRMYHGIIVQLPLPEHCDRDRILAAIPEHLDVDVLSPVGLENFREGSLVFPPVAGAVREVVRRAKVDLRNKKIVVIGQGRLVGQVVIDWLDAMDGLDYQVVTLETRDPHAIIVQADVIVSGAGDPGFIKPEHIKKGVVIIDAGTSESNGVVMGDADPTCAGVASVFTPVPGGIGPITVAILFRNLIELVEEYDDQSVE